MRESGEIIVTARRREESIQDVPIAISVASQEDLERKNIQSIDDLAITTPSLVTSGPYSNTPIVILRGQGGYTPGGIPSVLMYMNEVPFATSAQAGSPGGALGANGLFFDLESIQVAKGPQGTLFGRNAVGGAVLITSRKPDYDFGGHVKLTAGNYDNQEFDAAVNVPLVADTLALRIAANGQKRDGFTRVLTAPGHPNGLDLDDTRHFAVRGSLLADLGNIENLLIVDYLHHKHNGVSSILVGVNPNPLHPVNRFFPGLAGLVPQQEALGIRKQIGSSSETGGFVKRWSITNNTTIKLTDELTLKNIISYSRAKYGQTIDGDGTFMPFFDPIQSVQVPYITRQFVEEIQLQGESFDGKLNWVAGFFYLDSPEEDFFTNHVNATFGRPRNAGFKQSESSKAIFAQGDISLTDQLSVTLGARYTWETIGRASRQAFFDGACFSPVSDANCVLQRKGSFQEPTWTIGLNYKPNDDTLLYVASRRGFRSGGFNLDGDVPAEFISYDSEIVTDLEFGAKTKFDLGGAIVTANIAAYRQWYNDIQLQQTTTSTVTNGSITINRNAGKAKIDGVEFEGNVVIGDLTLRGHLTYTDFRYTFFAPDVILPIIPTVPKWAFGVGAQYYMPLPDDYGELSVSASYDHRGKRRITSYEDPFSQQPSYGLLSLSADWRNVAGSPFDLSFFMSNVTNKKYARGGLPIFNALGLSALAYGEPRMYGVRFGFRFGGDAD
ncbi:MAG: TonB-dependent receptor [Novosphingobium sp.]|nr:TonB-dependent receptor [Novosphingobium sp.]